VRRLSGVVGAVVLAACASAGTPPGGPERREPPRIVATNPDSGATNVKISEVEFKFDEVVNDHPTGPSATLDQLFMISPRDGSASVSWHRSRITVRPRRGFRANTAYRITMLPGLADLRGNVRKEGATILFSTGATFPTLGIVGTVFDWAAQHTANGAYVEAISLADTTLAYISATDSLGRFDVGPLPAGDYLVRALIDQNNNRAIDLREKWDSVTTHVAGARPNIELDAIERDSVPAALVDVVKEDSLSLRVSFDKALNPAMALQPSLFRLQRADSSLVQIANVQWGSAFARARETADSLRRAAADTTRRPAPRPAAPPTTGNRPAPAAAKPKAPPPENVVILTVSPATPLTPGRYVLFAHGIVNMAGRTSTTELRRGFTIAPPTPRDTSRTPGDTTRRPPGRPPR
jgi:hypothetical protein